MVREPIGGLGLTALSLAALAGACSEEPRTFLDVSIDSSGCSTACPLARHTLVVLKGVGETRCRYAWAEQEGAGMVALEQLDLAQGEQAAVEILAFCQADPCLRCEETAGFVAGSTEELRLSLATVPGCSLPGQVTRPCAACLAAASTAYCDGALRVTCEQGKPVAESCPYGCVNGVCQSGECTDKKTFYRDQDGDSHGSTEARIEACDSPPGYVDRGGDCDDANAKVFPGQTAFFTEPTQSGSYDYDCDHIEEKQWPLEETCRIESGACVGEAGWDQGVADCGASEYWEACKSGLLCLLPPPRKTQACR